MIPELKGRVVAMKTLGQIAYEAYVDMAPRSKGTPFDVYPPWELLVPIYQYAWEHAARSVAKSLRAQAGGGE